MKVESKDLEPRSFVLIFCQVSKIKKRLPVLLDIVILFCKRGLTQDILPHHMEQEMVHPADMCERHFILL